jgi:hypothetical protein
MDPAANPPQAVKAHTALARVDGVAQAAGLHKVHVVEAPAARQPVLP